MNHLSRLTNTIVLAPAVFLAALWATQQACRILPTPPPHGTGLRHLQGCNCEPCDTAYRALPHNRLRLGLTADELDALHRGM